MNDKSSTPNYAVCARVSGVSILRVMSGKLHEKEGPVVNLIVQISPSVSIVIVARIRRGGGGVRDRIIRIMFEILIRRGNPNHPSNLDSAQARSKMAHRSCPRIKERFGMIRMVRVGVHAPNQKVRREPFQTPESRGEGTILHIYIYNIYIYIYIYTYWVPQ